MFFLIIKNESIACTPNHTDFSLLLEYLSTEGLHSHRTLFNCAELQPHLIISIFLHSPASPPSPLSPQPRAGPVTAAAYRPAWAVHLLVSVLTEAKQCLSLCLQQKQTQAYPCVSSRSRGGRQSRRAMRSKGPPPILAPAWSLQGICVFPTGARRHFIAYGAKSYMRDPNSHYLNN